MARTRRWYQLRSAALHYVIHLNVLHKKVRIEFGLQSPSRGFKVLRVALDSHEWAAGADSSDSRRSRPHERIDHGTIRHQFHQLCHELVRFHRWVAVVVVVVRHGDHVVFQRGDVVEENRLPVVEAFQLSIPLRRSLADPCADPVGCRIVTHPHQPAEGGHGRGSSQRQPVRDFLIPFCFLHAIGRVRDDDAGFQRREDFHAVTQEQRHRRMQNKTLHGTAGNAVLGFDHLGSAVHELMRYAKE